MLFLALWGLVMCAGCAAAVAHSRGRDPLGWFVLSLVLMGVFGLILVALLPPQARRDDYDLSRTKPSALMRTRCPVCNEPIIADERNCLACRSSLRA